MNRHIGPFTQQSKLVLNLLIEMNSVIMPAELASVSTYLKRNLRGNLVSNLSFDLANALVAVLNKLCLVLIVSERKKQSDHPRKLLSLQEL